MIWIPASRSPSVLDEAELLELVHEEIDARPGGAHHLRQRGLRDLRDDLPRLFLFPVPRQQQERPRQPFLARVEELIDQVLLDADVSRQHVRDETIRQRVLPVQHLDHLLLLDDEDTARRDRLGAPDANGLSRETSLAKEIARAQHGHDRFSAGRGEHRELDAALLDVHHGVALIALREDHLGRPILHDPLRQSGRIEKGLGVERGHGSGHLARIRRHPVEDVCKKTHVAIPRDAPPHLTKAPQIGKRSLADRIDYHNRATVA